MFVLVMSDCPGSPIFARRLGGEAAEFPSTSAELFDPATASCDG